MPVSYLGSLQLALSVFFCFILPQSTVSRVGAGRGPLEGQPIEILLVEDNPGDVRLTLEGLRDARIPNRTHVVTDGAEALGFLRRQGKYADAPRPSIVFLDLHLPKISGHDVLKAMKEDESLKRIPVVVISGSGRREDVDSAYDEQVSFYLVKPYDVDQYFAAIRSIKELWFHLVSLPGAKAQGT